MPKMSKQKIAANETMDEDGFISYENAVNNPNKTKEIRDLRCVNLSQLGLLQALRQTSIMK